MRIRDRWKIGCVVVIVVLALVSSAEAGRRTARRMRVAPSVAIAPARPVPVAPSQATAPAAVPPAIALDPRQAMADILALRATHGGASDPAADAEFAGALGRLIAEKHGAPVAIPEPAIPTAKPTNSPVSALRTAAQHFDQRAAALEADKAYDQADAARETAADLRREARRLDP